MTDQVERRMPPEPANRTTSTSSGSTSSGRQSTDMGTTQSSKPVGEQAGQMAEDMKQQASQVKEQVAQQAESAMGGQKDRLVTQMSTLASALDDVSSSMREQSPEMAQFAESAVDKLNEWSRQLDRKDFSELVDDVERFARGNPALFIGGAFAVGLLGARFLKSSAPQSNVATRKWSQPAYDYSGREYGSYRQSTSGAGMRQSDYRTSPRQSGGYESDTGARRGMDMPSSTDVSSRDYPSAGSMSGGRSARDVPGETTARDYTGLGHAPDATTPSYPEPSSATDVE